MKVKSTNQNGFAAIILVVAIIAMVVVAAGYYYFSRTGQDYPGKVYVDKYSAPAEPTISESDEPEVIEKEFEETELLLDDFEKELDSLDSEVEQL